MPFPGAQLGIFSEHSLFSFLSCFLCEQASMNMCARACLHSHPASSQQSVLYLEVFLTHSLGFFLDLRTLEYVFHFTVIIPIQRGKRSNS